MLYTRFGSPEVDVGGGHRRPPEVLEDFYLRHAELFHRPPQAPQLLEAVWANKPEEVMLST